MRRSLLLLTLVFCLAAGSAWAADTGMLYAIDDQNNSLYSINPNTYALTFIGSTGIGSGDFGDLAYNPNTNTAYWVPGRDNDNLYSINLQTGAATLIGSHGVNDMFALGIDPTTNTLYGQTSGGDFYSLNTSNGAATFIGNNGVYAGGLTYRNDTQQLVLLEAGSPAAFWHVNPANGSTTLLGGNGFINDNGVAWDPAQGKFFIDDWSAGLYTADPNTYGITQVASLPTEFDGIIYVGAVPEPGTMLLLGSGIVGLATRLRRKF